MYTLSRAAHTRETTPLSDDITYENQLLDEKVNRQNNYKRIFDYNDVTMSTETTTTTTLSTNLSSNKTILNIGMESSSKRQPKITGEFRFIIFFLGHGNLISQSCELTKIKVR